MKILPDLNKLKHVLYNYLIIHNEFDHLIHFVSVQTQCIEILEFRKIEQNINDNEIPNIPILCKIMISEIGFKQ